LTLLPFSKRNWLATSGPAALALGASGPAALAAAAPGAQPDAAPGGQATAAGAADDLPQPPMENPGDDALVVARALLPTVPHPIREYNLPMLDVQRYCP